MAVSAPTSPRSTRSRESGITSQRLIPIGIVALAFLYPLIDKALGIGQIVLTNTGKALLSNEMVRKAYLGEA